LYLCEDVKESKSINIIKKKFRIFIKEKNRCGTSEKRGDCWYCRKPPVFQEIMGWLCLKILTKIRT